MHLIDTHAHLYFDQYQSDRDRVIRRAEEAEVRTIINIGIDLSSSQAAVDLACAHKGLYATAGVHPHDSADADEGGMESLKQLLKHPKVVAIGEVGLDYYRDLSPRRTQRALFRRFLEWSMETGAPLVIHTREADEDMLAILRNCGRRDWKGVFHCFSGDLRMAEKVMEMGFCISFTGTVTFNKARAAELVKQIPLDRLLLETDSPFMAPVPHRGKRNEPAYLNHIASRIAQLRDLPVRRVAETTTANAVRLFGLPPPDGD